MNLLQPQDKRSAHPGDSQEATRARRALYDAGYFLPLQNACVRLLQRRAGSLQKLLDVGCGDGALGFAISSAVSATHLGVDLSTNAIRMANKSFPQGRWVVANVDRALPFLDASFDAVLSITARRSPLEFARVLESGGCVLVAVPGEDDLKELRTMVQGDATQEDRTQKIAGEFATHFALVGEEVVEHAVQPTREDLVNLLTATYRVGRGREGRLGPDIPPTVTLAWRLFLFAKR